MVDGPWLRRSRAESTLRCIVFIFRLSSSSYSNYIRIRIGLGSETLLLYHERTDFLELHNSTFLHVASAVGDDKVRYNYDAGITRNNTPASKADSASCNECN